MRSRTQMQRIVSFNNKIKQRRTKTTPKGKNKQAGRQAEDWSTVNMKLTWRRHMKDNGSAQDCRHKENYIGRQTRVTRETQLEPLKQWLSNKMGGDRQSTWEHMAPTNNKPCALHTETSGGQPGHTSRTVTVWTAKLCCLFLSDAEICKMTILKYLKYFFITRIKHI